MGEGEEEYSIPKSLPWHKSNLHIGSERAPKGGNIVCSAPQPEFPDSRALWPQNMAMIIKSVNNHQLLLDTIIAVLDDCDERGLSTGRIEAAKIIIQKIQEEK